MDITSTESTCEPCDPTGSRRSPVCGQEGVKFVTAVEECEETVQASSGGLRAPRFWWKQNRSGSAKRQKRKQRQREELARAVSVDLTQLRELVAPESNDNKGVSATAGAPRGGPCGTLAPKNKMELKASSDADRKNLPGSSYKSVKDNTASTRAPRGGPSGAVNSNTLQHKTPKHEGINTVEGSHKGDPTKSIKRIRSDERVSPQTALRGDNRKIRRTEKMTHPNEKTDHRSYAEAANAHLSVAVLAEDYSEISPEQYTIIRKAVEFKHQQAVEDMSVTLVPMFERFPLRLPQGGLRFKCAGDDTREWLTKTVTALPPLWTGCPKLTVMSVSDLPKFVRAVVWVPDVMSMTLEELRFHLARTNSRWIDLCKWRVLSHEFKEVTGVRGALLVFGIPDKDVDLVCKRNYKLGYKTGSVTLRIATRRRTEGPTAQAGTMAPVPVTKPVSSDATENIPTEQGTVEEESLSETEAEETDGNDPRTVKELTDEALNMLGLSITSPKTQDEIMAVADIETRLLEGD